MSNRLGEPFESSISLLSSKQRQACALQTAEGSTEGDPLPLQRLRFSRRCTAGSGPCKTHNQESPPTYRCMRCQIIPVPPIHTTVAAAVLPNKKHLQRKPLRQPAQK